MPKKLLIPFKIELPKPLILSKTQSVTFEIPFQSPRTKSPPMFSIFPGNSQIVFQMPFTRFCAAPIPADRSWPPQLATLETAPIMPFHIRPGNSPTKLITVLTNSDALEPAVFMMFPKNSPTRLIAFCNHSQTLAGSSFMTFITCAKKFCEPCAPSVSLWSPQFINFPTHSVKMFHKSSGSRASPWIIAVTICGNAFTSSTTIIGIASTNAMKSSMAAPIKSGIDSISALIIVVMIVGRA